MPNIDFNFKPYREDIFFCGMKGTGKSTLIKLILLMIPNIRTIIWSPQRPYQNYGDIAKQIYATSQIAHDFTGRLLWVGDYSHKSYVEFLDYVFHNIKNVVVVHDDLHENVHKHSVLQSLSNLIQSGRNRGISNLLATTAPRNIPNWILGNVSHFFAFRMKLESDAIWLQKNVFGSDAWLLLPKDLRQRYFIGEQDPDVIPEYSYLYRKDSDVKTQFVMKR